MDFAGQTVLVTGIAGFVGANLARELRARGANVHGLERATAYMWRLGELLPNIDLHRTDLTDAPALEQALRAIKPSIVYHLATQRAARTPQERAATMRSNVLGTLNLLEAAASAGCERFIHVGSSLEYGPKDQPSREADLLAPRSFFGACKAAGSLLCRQFALEHRLPLVILRLYSVYGYWEGPERLIPTAILAALGNGSIALTAAPCSRDFVFALDVVEACLLAADANADPGEIFNVGTGQQWTNEQAIAMVESIAGRKLSRRAEAYPARPTDTTFWVADNDKARRILQWSPRHSLRDGLAKTWAWMVQHRDQYETIARAIPTHT